MIFSGIFNIKWERGPTVRKKTKICLGCLREISLYDSVCPFCGFDPIKVKNPRYLRAGTRLLDRYLVGRELGEGGFGITYVGYDTRQKRPVAVKEYFPAHIASRDTTSGRSQDVICFDGKDGKFFQSGLERFKKEGKTLEKASSCDSVIQVYDYLEENKTAYIVMEYVPGITVQQRVERQGIFTPEEMLLVVEPLMNDLQKLHEKGMLHRDISPDNIILRPDGVAKLVDFGSARRTVLDAQGNNKSMTVVVRQQYTPKEQYSRNGKQGPWTDIYSLAATMYFMLTGKAPVSALEREAEAANQKMRTGMQQIKASLADVLEEAMALNPDDRYADMQSFCEALKKEIPIAEGAKPIERTVYFDREKEGRKILPQWKKKRLYLGCGILALILVMVIAGKTMLSGTQKEKAAMAEKTPLATKAVTPSPTQALVTMPDVVGKETSDAIAAVRTMDANIAIIIDRGYSEKKKETVYRQSIKPGLQYTAGDKKEVILHISLGIKCVRVPNVTGKTLTEAKAVLSARGLKYTVKKQFSNSRKNSIIKQSRKKNVKVKEGTVIHLTVSRGEKKVSLASIRTRKPEPVATKKPKKIQIVTD